MTSDDIHAGSLSQQQQAVSKPVCLSPGAVVDRRYEILSLLGQGGMSIVYKARQIHIDRIVALKMLHTYLLLDQGASQRFQSQMKTATALNHPNIISANAFGVWDGQPYLVTDYLPGTTLAGVLKGEARLPAARAVHIFQQICDALIYAHGKGVIHGDIKPGNILLLSGGHQQDLVKLLDFGIAAVLPPSGRKLQALIQKGQLPATILYLSPEQCVAQSIDARSDIYALGCLMYETLSGRPPFVAENPIEILSMHLHKDPLPFEILCPDCKINADLEAIVFKALEKDPSKRFQAVSELEKALGTADLTEAKARPAVPAKEKRAGWRQKRLLWILVVSWLVLAAASLIIGYREALHVAMPIHAHAREHCLQARRDFDRNRLAAALAEINEAISIEGNDWESYCLRARIYEAQGDSQAALGNLSRVQGDSDTARASLDQAQEDYRAALGNFSEAIRFKKDNAGLYVLRAGIYMKLELDSLAVQDLSRALELDPGDCHAWRERGGAFAKQGQLTLAISDFDRSICLSPRAETYNCRARAYNKLKEFDKALADTDEAIRLKPKLAESYYLRFLIQQNRGKRGLAENDYRKAIELGFHPELEAPDIAVQSP